jgi:hypothetical protein
MPGPIGNQHALGNNGGRPKEYDRIQIGRDFVEWATNNIEALTVPMFATSIGLHSGIMRNWARENDEFRALFREGKEQIGINRLRATQQDLLDNSIYRGHIGNYDIDINEYIREEKAFDAALSHEGDSKPTQINIKVSHDGLGSGIDVSTKGLSNTLHIGSQ